VGESRQRWRDRLHGGTHRARPFPWPDVMAAGLGLLRLPPAHFWSMTPKELAAALSALLGATHSDAPLPRAALTQLMSRFPD
jgi:uncharacterized phage protein (TIGR02216 family)